MHSQSFLLLGDDILDRIFTFLPDFKTLAGLILASKTTYAIFQSRPHSIITSICYNIIGPAFPQAIRIERYESRSYLDELESEDLDAAQWFSSPENLWSEKSPISPISKYEAEEVIEQLETVQKLEDIFSRRHKKRTGTKLSFDESWRFRRALYRFWLYTLIFSMDEFPNPFDIEDDDESEEERFERLEAIDDLKRRQHHFLHQFPSNELQELYTISVFFIKLLESVFQEEQDDFPRYMIEVGLAVGPSDLLNAYQDHDADGVTSLIEEMDSWDFAPLSNASIPYIIEPLSRIWKERAVDPPHDESHWKSILSSDPTDERQSCQKCGKTHRFDLWNKTNWDLLVHLNLSQNDSLFSNIRGRISRNAMESKHYRKYTDELPFNYVDLMTKIHRIRTAKFESWNDEDWLCTSCLKETIVAHLHLWLLEKKREDGIPIPSEDCRDGYNCCEQRDLTHASEYNHLCDPK